jgi:hypothetical protein
MLQTPTVAHVREASKIDRLNTRRYWCCWFLRFYRPVPASCVLPSQEQRRENNDLFGSVHDGQKYNKPRRIFSLFVNIDALYVLNKRLVICAALFHIISVIVGNRFFNSTKV